MAQTVSDACDTVRHTQKELSHHTSAVTTYSARPQRSSGYQQPQYCSGNETRSKYTASFPLAAEAAPNAMPQCSASFKILCERPSSGTVCHLCFRRRAWLHICTRVQCLDPSSRFGSNILIFWKDLGLHTHSAYSAWYQHVLPASNAQHTPPQREPSSRTTRLD